MTDDELIDRIKTGDEQAFKTLFDRHAGSVFGLCLRMVGNRLDAEDLTQEIFFRVFRSASSFDHRSRVSTWIFRIALNQALNRLRDRKRDRILSLDWLGGADERARTPLSEDRPDEDFERKEKRDRIWKAVQALPPSQRAVIVLQKYEGLSCEAIAEVMGCSVLSVQSKLHRAKQTLSRQLRRMMDR